MAQHLSLHYLRSRTTLLKYTLVVSLLLSIALSIFSDWHSPDHILKTDQHCALCFVSTNLDQSLPAQAPSFPPLPHSFVAVVTFTQQALSMLVWIAGNRDPPFVI